MAAENGNGATQPSRTDLVEQWAAITGRWRFSGQHAAYLGAESAETVRPFGLALAAKRIRDGRIHTQIKLSRLKETSAGLVLGYQSLNTAWVAVTLGGFDGAYTLVEFRPGFGFSPLDSAGSLANLEADKIYDLNVTLLGQSVRMTVDQVEVLSAVLPRPLEGTGVGLYAYDTAEVVYPKTEVTEVRPSAFVIMPFSEPYDSLYRGVIKPIADRCGFDINRIDEVRGPGIILNDIQEQIQRAHVVVAEISTTNPNVFYELGYAHALDKPAVLLVQREKLSQLPFDIRGYRAIPYDDSISGKEVVERSLEQNLNAVMHGAQEIK